MKKLIIFLFMLLMAVPAYGLMELASGTSTTYDLSDGVYRNIRLDGTTVYFGDTSSQYHVKLFVFIDDVTSGASISVKIKVGLASATARTVPDFNTSFTTDATESVYISPEIIIDDTYDTLKLQLTSDQASPADEAVVVIATVYDVSSETTPHTWHVAKTGNASNGGTSFNDAVLTIGQALTLAADGDEIYIWPGAYDENVDLDTANKSLTLTGHSRRESIVDPATGDGVACENGTTIRNLSISAMEANTGKGVTLATLIGRVLIEDCYIEGSASGMEGKAGNISLTVRNTEIFSPTLALDNLGKRLRFDNCIIRAASTDALGAPDGTEVIAINKCVDGVFYGCNIWGWRETTDSTAGATCVKTDTSTDNNLVFDSCMLHAETKDASSSGDAIGVLVQDTGSQILLANCNVYVDNGGSGTTDASLKQTAGTLTVVNSLYDESLTSGTITLGDVNVEEIDADSGAANNLKSEMDKY
jgi:pectin methylesterase-like acyl-CoA thioesterase